jgi:CRP-like cAMP-binding protein
VQIVSNPSDQQQESVEDISKGLNLKFARTRILMPGEALFEVGDSVNSFFVVASGQLCALNSQARFQNVPLGSHCQQS